MIILLAGGIKQSRCYFILPEAVLKVQPDNWSITVRHDKCSSKCTPRWLPIRKQVQSKLPWLKGSSEIVSVRKDRRAGRNSCPWLDLCAR